MHLVPLFTEHQPCAGRKVLCWSWLHLRSQLQTYCTEHAFYPSGWPPCSSKVEVSFPSFLVLSGLRGDPGLRRYCLVSEVSQSLSRNVF